MKIYTAALTLLVFTFSACKKNQTVCLASQPAAESVALAEFCTANGINYTVDANGIYYEILQQGIGSFPANDSLITVAYTSSDLNGNIYNLVTAGNPTIDYLKNFIEGWRLALPYIQKGGHIKMVVPSSLCYGCTGSDAVPPNTPLYFDIYLIDVSS